MSKCKKNDPQSGFAIGISLGLVFGLMFNNLALGLVFGSAFGLISDAGKARKKPR